MNFCVHISKNQWKHHLVGICTPQLALERATKFLYEFRTGKSNITIWRNAVSTFSQVCTLNKKFDMVGSNFEQIILFKV